MATNRELVEGLYSSIGRIGDPEGISYWTNRLESGESLPSVADAFKASANYVLQQDLQIPYYASESPLPYYSGVGDIYSRIMSKFPQQNPAYAAYGNNFTGGYDPSLYGRFVAPQTGANEIIQPAAARQTEILGGATGAVRPPGGNTTVIPPGSVSTGGGDTGGGGGGLIGTDGFGALGQSNLGDPNSITGGLLGGLIGGNTMAAVDSIGGNLANLAPVNEALDIGLMGQVAADAAAAAAAEGIAAADGVGTSGIGEGMDSVSMGESIGADGPGSGGGADGGGGGGGGGKIICTKLHELGKMPTEIYEADQAFGALLVQENPTTYNGYICWAKHVVRWISRDDLFGKFVLKITFMIATPWSRAMAHEMGVNVKSGWFGRFLLKQGLKVCQVIGNMKKDRSVKNV